MFYSDAILSKRGPLGRVWLAAHMERKLSKTQTLQTDISQSVDAIIGGETEVMALRLSGQLLLGVVRIYNRKAKYLLDDCNEAMLKLKMAFRAGPVDMTNAQLTVDRNAITLQGDSFVDLDILPDINWDIDFDEQFQQHPRGAGGQHVARQADITLAADDELQFDYGDGGLDIGPSDGIGSQDFELDLGIDFGDVPPSDIPPSEHDSVEMGRDAARPRMARDSLASHVLGRDDTAMDVDLDILSRRSREPSEHPFDADMNLDFGDAGQADLTNLGIGFGDEEREKTPGITRSPTSPLSSPPQTPPQEFNLELPPVTEPGADAAADGAQAAEGAASKEKRPRKEKKQIVDAVTELADGPGAKLGRGRGGQVALPVPKDNSAILAPARFLPRDPLVARLLQIRADPLTHFLPTTAGADGSPSMFCAAPPGVAPELAQLFMRPARSTQQPSKRRAAAEQKEGTETKKRRVGGDEAESDDDDVEGVRRQSVAPSLPGSDILGGRASSIMPGAEGFDIGGDTTMMEEFQMDMPDFGQAEDILPRARSASAAPGDEGGRRSRLSTPGVDEADEGVSFADATCPISAFDTRSQSQQESSPSDDSKEDGKGYSKNTVKALGLIRRELQPDEEDEEKVMSFAKMSTKASRRAAASFFFELLVISTRDCISVNQTEPYADIEVRAKDKLWERQTHASGSSTASAPPSVASATGL